MARPTFTKGKGKSIGGLIEKGPSMGMDTVPSIAKAAPMQKGIARGVAAMKAKMKGR
jgi:hypothetical protein